MGALIDYVLTGLAVAGSLLICLAGLGLALSRDAFSRIEVVAKGASVGLVLTLMGVAVAAGDFAVFMRAVASAAFVLMNALMMGLMLAERLHLGNDASGLEIDESK